MEACVWIVPLSELVGKTIVKLEQVDDWRELRFFCSDKTVYALHHVQDCCENVYLEDVNGELGICLEDWKICLEAADDGGALMRVTGRDGVENWIWSSPVKDVFLTFYGWQVITDDQEETYLLRPDNERLRGEPVIFVVTVQMTLELLRIRPIRIAFGDGPDACCHYAFPRSAR